MLHTRRRSMIVVFLAFVLFGLPWLGFMRMDDPLSVWNPAVRLHPEINIVYRVLQYSGEIAFLMLLALGLPILFSAIRYAFATRRRDVLTLLGIAAGLTLGFIVLSALILSGAWSWWKNIDPVGLIYVPLFLVVLLVVAASLALAVARSEPAELVLRFALVPATVVTVAMGVGLLATLVLAWLLSSEAPDIFGWSGLWIVGGLMMAVALLGSIVALLRGMHARPPAPTPV
jgi:hypothetical protein